MTDRDRYLARLSPAELLMYRQLGGGFVTRLMEVGHARAAREVGAEIDREAVRREGLPRGTVKQAKPLVYLPGRGSRRAGPAYTKAAAKRRVA